MMRIRRGSRVAAKGVPNLRRRLGEWAVLFAVLFAAIPAAAQKNAPEVAQKEEALAASQKVFAEAERGIRSAYDAMEKALTRARGDQGAVWKAEIKRVLEPLSAGAVAVAQKKGNRAQIQAVFKREAPPALKKIENKDLLLFDAALAARLATVANDVPIDAAKLDAGPLAELVCAELLGPKPFHEFWNDTFSDVAPAADAFRKASDGLDKAKWDVEVAKDPVLQWQRGAPAGFARVPAGTYCAQGTSGYAAQGARKGKKPVALGHDVFVGLREVTHGEFFEWWKTLDAAAKKKHEPIDGNAKQPLWPTPDGAAGPQVPPEMAQKPVSGITLVTAIAYATSRGARVPTEGEWCAAAGGHECKLYPWGDSWQAEMCNDREHQVNDVLPVGTMPGRGPFGHYDLAGNVAEWTATYENGKDIDPAKFDEGANAVIRGGSYAQSKEEVSNGWVWYDRAFFTRQKTVGFRLAMDAKK